jgi:hypothetical protein
VIGHATGHTGAGALIGAGTGALAGGLVGHAEDRAERKAEERRLAGTLGITDVVRMAQSGVSDPVIVTQIRSTGSVFHLSSSDTIWLKQQGVSDPVVQAMLATGGGYLRHGRWASPVYADPVYVVQPAPVTVTEQPAQPPAPAVSQTSQDLPGQPVPVH